MLRSMRSKLARRSNEKNNDKNAAGAASSSSPSPRSSSSLDAEQQQAAAESAAASASAGPSGRSQAAPGPVASSAPGHDASGTAHGDGRGIGTSGPGPGPGPGGGGGGGGDAVDNVEANNKGNGGDRPPPPLRPPPAAAAPSSLSAPSTPRTDTAVAAAETAAAAERAAATTTNEPSSSNASLTAAQLFANPLPSFRDVTSAEKPALFLAKLRACSAVFDFGGDPTAFAREKEAKRQALLELVDYVNGSPGRFTEASGADVVAMVSSNLFRALPPRRGGSGGGAAIGDSPTDGGGGGGGGDSSSPDNSSSTNSYQNSLAASPSYSLADPEEEEPTLEPAWPHLQIVYELLLRYVVSPDTDARLARRHVDQAFVVRLLELFDSEDSRERDYLKTILHRVYGKFMSHRPFIRRSINHVFYRFVFETERHAGIAELLEILGSIINGFALPLKEEHKAFLARVLMPLHKPKCVGMYHQQLAYCVAQFVEKDARLAAPVISSLLRYWPATNSQKEVLFLGEVEELLELTREEEFAAVAGPLFSRVARCLTSPHFQVAERTLFLWNNEYVVTLVAGAREAVLPRVFGALAANAAGHWNGAVAGLSANVRRLFQEMDPALFDRCAASWEQEEGARSDSEARRARQWEAVERAAEAERRRREQAGEGGGGRRRR